MKSDVRKRSIFVALAVTVVLALALIGTANAKGPAKANKSEPKSSSSPDKVDAFMKTLEKAGFGLQEGEFKFGDLVQECCAGNIPDTLANNPWPNIYILIYLEPHPGVTPASTNLFWQLGKQEAIVLVGQTPPPAAFFSYQTFFINLPGSRKRRGVPVGDSINIGTINTMGPDPYNRPIVYIITGHRGTEKLVRAAALKAGYPASIINVETISPVIAPMATGDQGSWFAFGHRVAVPIEKAEVEEYAKHPPYKVFRITPNDQLAWQLGDDPEPVPTLRVRGTGQTEMELYPAQQRLRQAILDKYEQAGYGEEQRKELDSKVWELVTRNDGRELKVEKPYVGLQRGIQVIGSSRDTNYLGTYPNFMLRENVDEFVIVYGVNHQETGKATYSSVSIYADKDRWFGPANGGTMTSPNFGDSARHYLPDDPAADILYAIKVARNCNGEDHCMEVQQPDFLDIYNQPYKVNPGCILGDFLTGENPHPWNLNEHEMFFLFRGYMEPATKVGPDDNELLYDRAIYFGPYFTTKR